MPKILIVSSNVHKDLAPLQLNLCLSLVKNAGYDVEVESLQAGVYEIPFVINTYQKARPFDAYIALGLILNANSLHFENIMSHIRTCFTNFALNDIIVGNGIVTGATLEELQDKIQSQDHCLSAYPSAFRAVDSLITLKNKLFIIKS